MRNLVMILLGLALIIGLSAGPAMAIRITNDGVELFFDDFEGPTTGSAPDNGAYPGEWATYPGPWNAVIYSDSGDATIENVNPFDGNGGSQHMRRQQLNGSSHADKGPTVGVLESVATSGDIHAEVMFSWESGNNRFNDGFGLAPADAPAGTGPWDTGVYEIAISALDNSLYFRSHDAAFEQYGFTSFDFASGDYHKLELDHTIGTSEWTITVTDVLNDPDNPVSETHDLGHTSTDIGHVVFRQGNDFLSYDWDDVGDIPPHGCPENPDDCSPADLNTDSFVDGIDLGILLGEWDPPPTPTSGGGTIPEPASIGLLAVASVSLLAARRRRS